MKFYSDDFIFHYTKMDTCQKIWESKQLRLSNTNNSRDPFEKLEPMYNSVSSLEDEAHDVVMKEAERILVDVKEEFSNSKQLSFCTNRFDSVAPMKDDLGYLKFRMWEQYADNFGGVCMVFSRSLLDVDKETKADYVSYLNYEEVRKTKIEINLSSDMITDAGKSILYKELCEGFMRKAFVKHKDYRDECEFRLFLKNGSREENEYVGFPENALKAVIFSNRFSSEADKKKLAASEIYKDVDFYNLIIDKDSVWLTPFNRVVDFTEVIKLNR